MKGRQEISMPSHHRLRLAAVYLNLAEALEELGRLNQNDLDRTINVLRDRVNMPHLMMDVSMDPKFANDGISALLEEIRRERRIEMFLEGRRYHDLLRWKMGKYHAMPDLGMRWDDTAISRYPKAKVKTTIVNGVPYRCTQRNGF